MCLDGNNHPPIAYVIDEYEHGSIGRREFLRRATALVGAAGAAALLAACSPQAMTSPAAGAQPTVPPLGTVPADAANIQAETVTFPSEGGAQIKGYLARPTGPGAHRAVIIIHENRGLTPHQQDLARRYASAGFVALAVDLLSRQGGTDKFASAQEATAAIGRVTDEQATADLNAAVAYLKGHDAVKGQKIGVTGHCWGGARTILLALRNPDIAAAVPYYGSSPQSLDEVNNLKGALLGIYAGNDQRINAGVPPFEEKLKAAGKTYEIKTYDGANHAFFNDTGASFKVDAAQDAWARTIAWFNKYLRG